MKHANDFVSRQYNLKYLQEYLVILICFISICFRHFFKYVIRFQNCMKQAIVFNFSSVQFEISPRICRHIYFFHFNMFLTFFFSSSNKNLNSM